VRRRFGSKLSIGDRMDINVLMWYCHVESMEDERVVKSVYWAKVVDEGEYRN
jgi:hypothetical protein